MARTTDRKGRRVNRDLERTVTVASFTPYDRFDPTNSPRLALVGECDFSPLRAPAPAATDTALPVELEAPGTVVELEAPAAGPGIRVIDGRPFYSSRWL
jgi:hypothetical protein